MNNKHTAKKYGTVIHITIPKQLLDQIMCDRDVDGVGDSCLVFEGQDWDEVLIEPEFLSCPILDHELGICDSSCVFCQEELR